MTDHPSQERRKTNREEAREWVLSNLRSLYLGARKNTHMRGCGSLYRREIARLYLAALRAVESRSERGREP
jgi:hypothetical protein